MDFNEAISAVRHARETIQNGDHMLRGAARLLRHRLRAVEIDGDVLADLKRELQQFDSRAKRWKLE
jgi:hypothetical protein